MSSSIDADQSGTVAPGPDSAAGIFFLISAVRLHRRTGKGAQA